MAGKKPQPKRDAPGYVREPLKVSKDGKTFSVDAAKVCDLLEWYRANKIAVFPYGKTIDPR